MSRGLLLLALLAGCGGPAAREAPRFDGPLSEVGARRPPLYHQALIFQHQVALDLPDRSEVLIGQMRFPGPERYALYARTPFGLDLFELGFDGAPSFKVHAAPLEGAFPAEALAEEIAWIYLRACPPEAIPTREKDALRLRCGPLTERLDPRTLAVTARTIDQGARRVDVRYENYAWIKDRWLARRITLESGAYKVEILLSDAEEIDAPKE